jgi:hypothetical protein
LEVELSVFLEGAKMPIHDWTRVEAGIFHHFHQLWTGHISEALNAGLLPSGYYAMVEQHADQIVPDVLALHARDGDTLDKGGGIAVLEAPPKTSRKLVGLLRPPKKFANRHVAIRHVSDHRVIAMIEIVSPANKDRLASVKDFALKARAVVDLSVHLLIVDLFPPGKHDRRGMHGAIWKTLGRDKETPPGDKPLCLMSYVAKMPPDAYLEWLGVGARLPEMPLFLDAKRYVNVPLESTYQQAYAGVPEFWREVIEKRA